MLMLAMVVLVIVPTSSMQASAQPAPTAAIGQQPPPQTQAAALPASRASQTASAGMDAAALVQQAPATPAVAAPVANSQQAAAPGPGSAQSQLLTIPAGTRIPLTLANPIYPKHARRGDSIHATTAFPVTLGSQVAIPAGVLVEGVVDKLVKKDRLGHPWIQAHFTRMVFPNGYVLSLEAQSTEARAKSPESFHEQEEPVPAHENGPSAGDALDFQFQQPPNPTLPPLPKPNYTPAIVGGVVGVAAAVAIAIIAAHHRYDYFWYDVGFQFDMVLQSPLQLDAANWNADVSN
jgi:hypothetical protein